MLSNKIINLNLIGKRKNSDDIEFATIIEAKAILMGYSLESPRWGNCNEYLQHMFLWRNRKNYP